MRTTGVHPADVAKSAVYGAIHGATGGDLELDDVVASSLDAVRQSADQRGLSGQEALKYATEAAIEAAEGSAEEPQSQIREAVFDELMEDMAAQMEASPEDDAGAQRNPPPEVRDP